jgi:hypothetical protein
MERRVATVRAKGDAFAKNGQRFNRSSIRSQAFARLLQIWMLQLSVHRGAPLHESPSSSEPKTDCCGPQVSVAFCLTKSVRGEDGREVMRRHL